jgi:hypothetical protein
MPEDRRKRTKREQERIDREFAHALRSARRALRRVSAQKGGGEAEVRRCVTVASA